MFSIFILFYFDRPKGVPSDFTEHYIHVAHSNNLKYEEEKYSVDEPVYYGIINFV